MFEYERWASAGRSAASCAQRAPASARPDIRWLLYEVEPGTVARYIGATARFACQPDVSALEGALDALTARHPALCVSCVRDADCESPGPGAGWWSAEHVRTDTSAVVVVVLACYDGADVWSMTTLIRELEVLYAERAGTAAHTLPGAVTRSRDLIRLYRWVGGDRASVSVAAERGCLHRTADSHGRLRLGSAEA
jgi:hypothetical protein